MNKHDLFLQKLKNGKQIKDVPEWSDYEDFAKIEEVRISIVLPTSTRFPSPPAAACVHKPPIHVTPAATITTTTTEATAG